MAASETNEPKSNRRGKYKSLTLEQKIKVLIEVEKGEKKKSDIAKEYGILPNTLSTYIHNKDKILDSWKIKDNGTRKRLREGDHPLVDKCVRQWLTEVYDQNIVLNGTVIRTKAEEFSKQMGLSDFKASSGWLAGFKERNGLRFKKVKGKKLNEDDTEIKEWTSRIPQLIHSYQSRNIFVADETGLYYECLPENTYFYKEEKCNEGQKSNERLTLLFGANMDGSEKLPIVVVGSWSNVSKLVKSLPVQYEFEERAWITSKLFNRWLTKLDGSMIDQNRKIVLFLNERTAHANLPQLTAIKVIFFPTGITSAVKPMSRGIVADFKQLYRLLAIRLILENVTIGDRPNINFIDSVRMISKAWKQVKGETIAECFQKAQLRKVSGNDPELWVQDGISTSDDQLPFTGQSWQNSHHLSRRLLQYCPLITIEEPEEWNELAAKSLAYSSYQAYLNVDKDLAVCTNKEDPDQAEENDVKDESILTMDGAKYTVEGAKAMLDSLRTFVEAQENVTTETFDALDHLDFFVYSCRTQRKKKPRISAISFQRDHNNKDY